MSDEQIRLNRPVMEAMIATFKEGIDRLQDTSQQMQDIANLLEQGALQGQGGTAFVEAIRNKLCPGIARLSDKFNELAGDVQFNINEFFGELDPEAKQRIEQ
jgi:uncharacterized protein YukE